MISHAINSGAINAVPFPASELGASIVELIGTIEVVCEPASINLRITSAATSAPTATLLASTTSKIQLGATTQPGAVAADITPKQKIKQSAATTGVAVVASSMILRCRNSASAQATGTGTALSYQLAKRSASVSPKALTSASSLKYLYRSASIAGVATVGSISAKSKIRFSISRSAAAIGMAGLSIKSKLTATTAAKALTQAQGLSYLRLQASTSYAIGLSVANARLSIQATLPAQPAVANSGWLSTKMKFGPAAQSAASATTQQIKASLGLLVSATTTANAIVYSSATDYATKIPAPSERQIVVPAYDRTMKVI